MPGVRFRHLDMQQTSTVRGQSPIHLNVNVNVNVRLRCSGPCSVTLGRCATRGGAPSLLVLADVYPNMQMGNKRLNFAD